MRRHFALCLVLLVAAAGNTYAQNAARMSGRILDAASKALLADAQIDIEAVEGKTVKANYKGKKDGSFAIFVLDGTLRYKFTVSAPGYDPYTETIKLTLGDSMKKDFELNKTGSRPATTTVVTTAAPLETNVAAYNDGAALANAGDLDGAIKKFEEAVAAKPDMLAAWSALAKMYGRQKSWQKAIDAAAKVLDVDDSDLEMIDVQHKAYVGLGNKAKAEELGAKLPKNANALFNEAAKLINAGNDAAAEKLLQQAITVDEKFAQSHYEIGMIYVRAGKSAEAKAALTKYLELDPSGKDAATAKEMMNYLQ